MSNCECKECLHYEVCLYKPCVGECPLYKSKSLFVELPCKYGDTVFQIHIKHKHIREVKVVGFHLGDFPDLRGHKRKQYLVCYGDYTLYHIDLDQIGKTVFLTEEQAKEKLKEEQK